MNDFSNLPTRVDDNSYFAYCDKIAATNHFETIWSISDIDLEAPHPFANAKFVRYKTSYFWRDFSHENETDIILRKAIPGPTWLDLWRVANALIIETGDLHHIYIEAFAPSDDSLNLITGS